MTDRLWDKDVQEFIDACKHDKLADVEVAYSGIGSTFLSVSARYRTRRGRLMPIGYRWVTSEKGLTHAEVYLGTASAPGAHEAKDFFRLARRAGLFWERKSVAYALLAVMTVYFKAHAVRDRLQLEHLNDLKRDQEFSATLLQGGIDDGLDIDARRDLISQAQDMTLRTLNDLAHLYSAHSGPDST
ncbi:hypothetical protein [Paenarthrobacter sp. YJN-5]|uniref:hypothetical protein n=1 Tax=Paenarthrobacter sp. YJN-5 TaxID=2735316 RepID=UPI0018777EC7|nr:hypothetical protein [Paenarthrobacter sp. YJN-5]QOT19611.1 hypothetical protein HMI59_23625 [Paenarthrobacter sp. YJN-5]